MQKLKKERRKEWRSSWTDRLMNDVFEGKNRNEKRANWRKS